MHAHTHGWAAFGTRHPVWAGWLLGLALAPWLLALPVALVAGQPIIIPGFVWFAFFGWAGVAGVLACALPALLVWAAYRRV